MGKGVNRIMGTAKLQPRGQITIPAEIRRTLGWKPGDSISFGTTPDGVLQLRVIKRLPVRELLQKYRVEGDAPDLEMLRQDVAEQIAREKLQESR